MALACPSCRRNLDTSGERPRFCAYCGQSLAGLVDPSSQDTIVNARNFGETVVHESDPGSRRGADAVPDRIAEYVLIRALGSGGMGTVYEARDELIGRKVALKLIAPGHLDSADSVERFRQEGRLASTIAHPRCVFVFAADEDRGRPYIVMELMPGSTLQNLVEERGALPPEEAVARILEVIEGLAEAHQLGVLHRDVKPSNCFLDGDGRAKIGDFGLSKSLATASHLTRTGAFIGTPLYSSPEQIRGEILDVRTDVYSVSATLYFLVAGKPPHEASDAASTLAKIVADPVPPLRSVRPEVPQALDRVVLKGLERSRDRRWPELEELRKALLPFVAGRVTIGGVGLRAAAFFLDVFVLKFLVIFAISTASAIFGGKFITVAENTAISIGLDLAIWFGIFGVMESALGWSPGKWLFGLRVRSAEGGADAGFARVLRRSLVLFLMAGLPVEILMLAEVKTGSALFLPAAWVARLIGLVVAGSTMRASNGYRGLHELASGTRVVRLVAERRRGPQIRREFRPFRAPLKRPAGVIESLGPFRVGGAVRWEPTRRVLLGEDLALKRQVWIVMRPKGSPPPPAVRRDLARATRPRWLTGGDRPEGRWDAYGAPSGCPLADLAGIDGLPWPYVRPLLQNLADELAASEADGTLPGELSVEQVWVEPDGRALLVDTLAIPVEGREPDESRAIRLLRQVAAIALEGGRRRADDDRTPIRAVVPAHALDFLARLTGGPAAFRDASEAACALREFADLPDEVGQTVRASRLVAVGVVCGIGLFWIAIYPLMLDYIVSMNVQFAPDVDAKRWERMILQGSIVMASVWLPIWTIWSFATRGGLTLRPLGLEVVRGDGLRAGRFRHFWRSFLTWAPAIGLVDAGLTTRLRSPSPSWPFWTLWGLGIAWLLADAAVAMLWPSRSIHDRLSGTHVVPK